MTVRLVLLALAPAMLLVACGEGDPAAPAPTALIFSATLGSDSVRPAPSLAAGGGTATLAMTTGTSTVFDPASGERRTLTYSVTVSDMTGEVTAANLRGPADANSVGDILAPLNIISSDSAGLVIFGSFRATSNPAVSMDSLLGLLNRGLTYLEVQTAAFPNGEIRGQIRP